MTIPLDPLANRLDWNLLRTFMVIVQEGGITRAADRLLLKQPTVSAALKRLEARLGQKLIERNSRSFRTTGAGETLYRECVEIYGNIARVGQALREVPDEVRGTVRVLLASHVVCPLFDDVLSEVHRAHPAIDFALEVMPSPDIIQAVRQKAASFGVCLVDETDPALDYERVFREYFGLFCGRRHRLYGRAGLALADLRGEPWVTFQTDQPDRPLRPVALLRLRERLGERIIGVSSELHEVRRLIIAGVGIGPMPIHVVERDVRDGLLWRLPPYADPPAIDVWLVTNPRARLNSAERALLAHLRAALHRTPESERTYPRLPSRAVGAQARA